MKLRHSLRTILILGSVCVFVVATVWFISVVSVSVELGEVEEPQDFPLAEVSASPYLNTSTAAKYLGSEACFECHAGQATTYQQTGHSRALADVVPSMEPAGATFSHQASGRQYDVFERDGKIYHRESLRSSGNFALVTTEFPVRFLVGSGRHTRSYLVEDDGFLAESPITWYASTKSWNMSPGYDSATHAGFGRMVGTNCLTCHVGMMDAQQQQYRNIGIMEQAIGCERCHGPGSLHAERHREFPEWEGDDLTIVHPASLSRALSEDICGQCHLQSAATISVRSRSFSEFRPGLPLTDFWIDYTTTGKNVEMTVTGHVEQIRQSRCYQQSELTCISCHSMHDPPADKVRHYRQTCIQCHMPEDCGLGREPRLKRSPIDNCVECHMPTSSTDIPHVAFTHHRIAIHLATPHDVDASNPVLVPVQDTSQLPEIERERCLGLAYLQFSENGALEEASRIARQKSMDILTSVYDRGLQDGETLAALAQLFAGKNDEIAKELATRAIAASDISVASLAAARFALADIYFNAQHWQKAALQLEQLVQSRRVYEDWFLLGSCYLLSGKSKQAIETLEQAQSIAPFRPEVHQLLSRCYEQIGDPKKASHHRSLHLALEAISPTRLRPPNGDGE